MIARQTNPPPSSRRLAISSRTRRRKHGLLTRRGRLQPRLLGLGLLFFLLLDLGDDDLDLGQGEVLAEGEGERGCEKGLKGVRWKGRGDN